MITKSLTACVAPTPKKGCKVDTVVSSSSSSSSSNRGGQSLPFDTGTAVLGAEQQNNDDDIFSL